VISLELIQRSMVVEVSASDLETTSIPAQTIAAA